MSATSSTRSQNRPRSYVVGATFAGSPSTKAAGISREAIEDAIVPPACWVGFAAVCSDRSAAPVRLCRPVVTKLGQFLEDIARTGGLAGYSTAFQHREPGRPRWVVGPAPFTPNRADDALPDKSLRTFRKSLARRVIVAAPMGSNTASGRGRRVLRTDGAGHGRHPGIGPRFSCNRPFRGAPPQLFGARRRACASAAELRVR